MGGREDLHDFFISRPLPVQVFFWVKSPARFGFVLVYLRVGNGGGGGGGGGSSAAIFNNLDAPHNLNAWYRLQTNINFTTLHTLFWFTINIKQKTSVVYHFIYKMFIRLFRVIKVSFTIIPEFYRHSLDTLFIT